MMQKKQRSIHFWIISQNIIFQQEQPGGKAMHWIVSQQSMPRNLHIYSLWLTGDKGKWLYL
jgi:hypothetical protein